MPDRSSKCRQLAAVVQTFFDAGLRVDAAAQHFIFSAVPIEDIHQLATLFSDPLDCEMASLLEMIYFPDESHQIRLEGLLESGRFRPGDIASTLGHLLSGETTTRIYFADLQKATTIETPERGARAFLERLTVTRRLSCDLIRVIDQVVDRQQAVKYKVWLRNMTAEPQDRDEIFLKDLFLKMVAQYSSPDDLVRFALRFLEESRQIADLTQALIQRRHRCMENIRRQERVETHRRRCNVETLLARGIRMPHIDSQVLMHQVALIDEICLALYGRSM